MGDMVENRAKQDVPKEASADKLQVFHRLA